MALLTGPTADALRRGRDRYNTKFALARRTYPALAGEALGRHLCDQVAPVVEAVAEDFPPAVVDEVFDALYDISLELLGKEFFGAQSRYPALPAGWLKLLPALPRLLAQAPRRVAGAVTNALYNLAAEKTADEALWLAEMIKLAPHCADAGQFLTVGQIVAWRAGLAQYRAGALAAARTLPEELARRALELGPAAPAVDVAVARLEQEPWLHPARMRAAPGARQFLQVVAAVGSFRGFGGNFLTPPTVACQDGQIIVSDVESSWLLTADIYGATLHRLGSTLPLPSVFQAGFTINGLGKVECGPHTLLLPWLAGYSSAASNDKTLAVTLPLSHLLFLIALVEE
jgi:hypothetical protein